MSKSILVLSVAALFSFSTLHAQEEMPPQVPPPETVQTQPDAKAPDAVTGNDAAPSQEAPSVEKAPAEGAPPAAELTEEQILAKEKIIKLEAQLVEANNMINHGLALIKEGKPQEAIEQLLAGRNKLPPNVPKAEADYQRATKGLMEAHLALAQAALNTRDFIQATAEAKQAAEIDPTSKAPEKMLASIEKRKMEPIPMPPRPDLDKSPEFQLKQRQIKQLFREGEVLYQSGQYEEALVRYQQILLIDHDNKDAHLWISRVYKERRRIADTMADVRRDEWLWKVTDLWNPPIPGGIKPPEKTMDTIVISQEEGKKVLIRQKLRDIVIPKIDIVKGYIQDIVVFLREQSKIYDPDKQGVDILMGGGLSATAPEAVAPAPEMPPPAGGGLDAEAPPVLPPVPGASPEAGGNQRITIGLNNATLGDALRYVTALAGLKYVIEGSAVLIVPKDYVPPSDMVTKVYPVSPTSFQERLSIAPSGGAAPMGGDMGGGDMGGGMGGMGMGGALPNAGPIDVKAFFEKNGVLFPQGSSLTYSDQTGRIIVRNTPENLEIFERILDVINIIPSQVEIETKFMEVSQSDLDELGFDWKLGTKVLGDFDVEGGSPKNLFPPGTGVNEANSDQITGGLRDSTILSANAIEALLNAAGFGSVGSVANNMATFRGVMTNPQFEVVIKALSQKRSSDLLSAPRITTTSGSQAQIRIVQEFIYPTEFDPPEVVASGGGVNGGGAVGITPSNPSSFRTREIGVLLNVTPVVGADGYTINLTVIPEVSEFLGFINYGGPIALSAGDNVVTAQNDIRQPLFASRNLTTSVVIWDGQTVVLGGLLREDIAKIHDKVPFLGDIPFVGRLFQSKVTQRSKRNLMIFVTAKLIKPDGTLLNPPEKNIFIGMTGIPAPTTTTPPTTTVPVPVPNVGNGQGGSAPVPPGGAIPMPPF